jgi:hypothetical protein
MSATRSSNRQTPETDAGPRDQAPASIAHRLGYYDPDSAAFDDDVDVEDLEPVDTRDEGLPVRELVTV